MRTVKLLSILMLLAAANAPSAGLAGGQNTPESRMQLALSLPGMSERDPMSCASEPNGQCQTPLTKPASLECPAASNQFCPETMPVCCGSPGDYYCVAIGQDC